MALPEHLVPLSTPLEGFVGFAVDMSFSRLARETVSPCEREEVMRTLAEHVQHVPLVFNTFSFNSSDNL